MGAALRFRSNCSLLPVATYVPIPAVPSVTICSQLQSMHLDCRGKGSHMESDLSLRGLQAFLRCRGLALDGCNVVCQAQVTHIADTNGTPLPSVNLTVIVAFCDLVYGVYPFAPFCPGQGEVACFLTESCDVQTLKPC